MTLTSFEPLSILILAMFTAIATFIGLYSVLTSLRGPFTDPGHILSRALRLGAKLRAWISGLSLLILPTGFLIMFIPDFWCGLLPLSLRQPAGEGNPGL